MAPVPIIFPDAPFIPILSSVPPPRLSSVWTSIPPVCSAIKLIVPLLVNFKAVVELSIGSSVTALFFVTSTFITAFPSEWKSLILLVSWIYSTIACCLPGAPWLFLYVFPSILTFVPNTVLPRELA